MFTEFDISNLEESKEILEELLQKSRAQIKQLLDLKEKTYDNFAKPYQLIAQEIEEFCTPIFHIDSVKNSETTQKVYSEILPLISIYSTELEQNEKIYKVLKDIQYKNKDTLNDIQNKVLENEIRDFELGGCALDEKQKEELKNINLKLSELSKAFSQNLLDATNEFELIIDNDEDVKGIPNSDLEIAKFTDENDDNKTKYKFTLQMPSYIAYMTYGPNRTYRETLYKAYTTRAPQNEEIIEQILALKNKKAKILGFDNYASLSLATKMANNENEVIEFLESLAIKGQSKAKEELQEVQDLAKELDGIDDIQSYDVGYYSEKLKKAQYDIDQEYYRPYFEKDSVINGFIQFLNDLFNIEFKEVSGEKWDTKVKIFDIYNENKLQARIYMDLEARKDKRGGAWMHNWHSKYNTNDKSILPTAFIVCNFPASNDTTPSLLRHDDVVTLFHEMGHAIHHLLTQIDEPFVSGINGVAWDVVEFPSQFLEYFAYEAQVLKTFAKHYKTNETLDDASIAKLKKARNFQSSISMLRQIEFALFDFKLHQDLYNSKQAQELLDNIRKQYSPLLPPSYNKFQNGFSHIFAGGYAAGYYSYKWAEVLSAHAFYKFIENGIYDTELSKLYKDLILGQGGSQDMDKLFIQLTGEKPDVDSLLKIDGIIS